MTFHPSLSSVLEFPDPNIELPPLPSLPVAATSSNSLTKTTEVRKEFKTAPVRYFAFLNVTHKEFFIQITDQEEGVPNGH